MQVKDTLGIRDKALEAREATSRTKKGASKAISASGAEANSVAEDTVALSERSRNMAKANEIATATSDLRRQKVEELKRQVANNEYQVDAEKVAHRMIVDFLGELV